LTWQFPWLSPHGLVRECNRLGYDNSGLTEKYQNGKQSHELVSLAQFQK
jgi:hypothetical protein